MPNLKKTLLAVLALTVVTAACADGPMAPEADVALTAAFGKGGKPSGGTDGDASTTGAPTFLHWIEPLAQDVTVSKLCDPSMDCTLSIDAIGAYLTVPINVLDAPTVITMTAVAGTEVNFVFGPHGTQFKKPVKIKVDQEKTNGKGRSFVALYWGNDLDDVLETIPVKQYRKYLLFETDHFSGYAIAM